MRVNRGRTAFFNALIVLLLLLVIPSLVFGQEEKEKRDQRPERGIAVYPEFSGVTVSRGESVKMDLTLDNRGRTDETIDVKISTIPKGWKASLRGGSYVVTGLFVPNGKSKNLALSLEPDKSVGPGTYVFQIDGQTSDGKFTSTQKLTVTVVEKTAGTEDIQITTSYPVLRGQTDAKFEFSLDVMNKSESDRNFNLAAVGPEKWEINFKPAYEQKQISSLRIKGGSSQTVAVEVTPAKDAQSGEYPILVRITSGDKKAEVEADGGSDRHLQTRCRDAHRDPFPGSDRRETGQFLTLREEYRFRSQPERHLFFLQAGELGCNIQARKDRCH